MLNRYTLTLISCLSIFCTGCATTLGNIVHDSTYKSCCGNYDIKPTYVPSCPSLKPTAIKTRINSKLLLQSQVSSVKPMPGHEQVASSGELGECFLPYGLRKEVFEQALGGTLRTAGLLALEFNGSEPNFILDARILDQTKDISDSHSDQSKKARLVIEYRLLLPRTEVVRWASTITTEHAYEQSSTKSGAMPDTLTSAFETAVRLNLEELLRQLDEYEQ